MGTVDIILRWLHVLPAMTMLGGAAFIRLAVFPTLGQCAEDVRSQIHAGLRARWAKVVMASIALLLLSGLANTARVSSAYKLPAIYHAALGIKILLALAVFFISSRLVGKSESAERMRSQGTFWLDVNLAFAVLIVLIAGIMRYLDHAPKG